MHLYNFKVPTIIFTEKLLEDIAVITKKKNCVIFTSKFWSKSYKVKKLKSKINVINFIDNISPNPSLEDVIKIKIDFKNIDYVISLGGGSVIDFTKAALAFFGVNKNKDHFKKTLYTNQIFSSLTLPKIIAIPTTSGTGSELNSWGTVWDNKNKHSVSGEKLLPTYVMLDTSLCISMPKSLTISSALDALSHAFESIWNTNNNVIVDEVAVIAIKKIRKYLPLVLKNEKNLNYRKEMQLAAFFAGMAMSQTKTAICHSISYPLTSIFGIPHGIACSLTLSEVSKLLEQQNKDRTSIISEAMNCKNADLESTIINFLRNINYGQYLEKLINIDLDDSINFINPVRAKNSLVKISNTEAIKMVYNAIEKYTN